jgi:hypothetical protein
LETKGYGKGQVKRENLSPTAASSYPRVIHMTV